MGLKLRKPTINGRISIGERDSEKGFPRKLDHFRFTHQFDKTKNSAPLHKEMTEVMELKYGKKPKEIDVILMHDHPDEVFYTNYMNYPGKECNCKGDGEKAQRKNGDGKVEIVDCNYENCKFRLLKTTRGIENTCKPTGILQCMITESPISGGLWRFSTHSKMTIEKMLSTLHMVYAMRGTLYDLRVKLKIVTVSLKVDNKPQNVHTVEIEIPYSMQEIVEGKGTTFSNYIEMRQKHKELGCKPNEEVVKDLEDLAAETLAAEKEMEKEQKEQSKPTSQSRPQLDPDEVIL